MFYLEIRIFFAIFFACDGRVIMDPNTTKSIEGAEKLTPEQFGKLQSLMEESGKRRKQINRTYFLSLHN